MKKQYLIPSNMDLHEISIQLTEQLDSIINVRTSEQDIKETIYKLTDNIVGQEYKLLVLEQLANQKVDPFKKYWEWKKESKN